MPWFVVRLVLFLKLLAYRQARSQDLEKGGAILKEWEVCKRPWLEFSLILNQFQTVCPKLEAKCLKARKFKGFFRPKLGDLQKKKKRSSPKFRVIFWPKSKIQSFFPPKIRWSQKKKKKKRSSPKLRLLFRAISQIQTFEGGLFSNGGAIFHFSQKIGLKSTKSMRFCILHKPMGGGSSPPRPPPGYATAYRAYLTVWRYQ